MDASRGPAESLRAYADALADGRADDAYRLLSDDAKRSLSLEAFRRMVTENREDAVEIARALRRADGTPEVTASVMTPDGEELRLVYEGGSWRIDGTGIDRYGQATPRQALTGFLRAFERKRYDIVLRYVPDKELEGELDAAWGPPEGAAPAPASATAEPAASTAPPTPAGSSAPSVPAASAAPSAPLGTREGLTAAKLKARWEGDQRDYISRIVQAIRAALPTARIEQTDDRAAMPYGAGGTVLFVREAGLWKIEDLQ